MLLFPEHLLYLLSVLLGLLPEREPIPETNAGVMIVDDG